VFEGQQSFDFELLKLGLLQWIQLNSGPALLCGGSAKVPFVNVKFQSLNY
jgi:hypothetical protein